MFRKGLIGKKLGMTQIFEDGARIPVTVVELGPNTIVQKKLPEGKDGYGAIQIGFGEKEHRKVNKAMTGHFNRADVKPVRELCEIRVPDDAKLAEYEVGQEIKADIFAAGDWVDITGTSIGKGFAGVMKRHNMKGSKQATHGTHEVFRHGGSIGMRSTPGRVMLGKRMPGHMGNKRVTTQNLRVVKVDLENNLVLIRGAVPGPKNGTVVVRDAVKKLGKALKAAAKQ
ncbi:MAG: 50S ribosomal protein L3 [Myxococcota bacterium]|nr:50S ribosomal protein L3 [Myxococcota bacterium]